MNADLEVLEQDAAARLVAAACKYETDLWNEQERLYSHARTQREARAAATPLLKVCAQCPISSPSGECARWARINYTGIAAGSAWVNGKPRPAHWVPHHPPRRDPGATDPDADPAAA